MEKRQLGLYLVMLICAIVFCAIGACADGQKKDADKGDVVTPEEAAKAEARIAEQNKYLCDSAAECVALARAGDFKCMDRAVVAQHEQYCGSKVEDADKLLRNAAESYVRSFRVCLANSDLKMNVAESCTGFCGGTDAVFEVRLEFAGCLVNNRHSNLMRMEIQALPRVSAQTADELRMKLADKYAQPSLVGLVSEQNIKDDLAKFRIRAADALTQYLRRYPVAKKLSVSPEELVSVISSLDPLAPSGQLEELRQRAWARKALAALSKLKTGEIQFPESIDKADEVRAFLEKGKLKPEQIGTSDEELRKLSQEDPIIPTPDRSVGLPSGNALPCIGGC